MDPVEDKNITFSEVFSFKTIVLLLFAIVFAVISSLTSVRNSVLQLIYPEQKVLAKINFTIADKSFTVFKLAKPDSVILEIYEKLESGNKLIQSFSFKGDNNALLQVKDVPVSLGVSEAKISGDFELFAPTFDKNGNSRLNAFRYDAGLNQFIQISSDEVQ